MKQVRTKKIKIQPTGTMIQAMKNYLPACNWLSEIVLKNKETKTNKLHKLYYSIIRSKFQLPSQVTCSLFRQVSVTYRSMKTKRKWKLAIFKKPVMPICFRRDFNVSKRNGFTIWNQPIQMFSDLPEANLKDSKIKNIKQKWYILLTYEIEIPDPKQQGTVVGVDRGIKRILVASTKGKNPLFIKGGGLEHLRRNIQNTKSKVQAVGTRSSKRLLQRLRRKEKSVTEEVLHIASKTLAQYAELVGAKTVVFENLTESIRKSSKSKGKRFRKQVHRWPYSSLLFKCEYKLESRGIGLAFVNPKNTSRGCPSCGFVSEKNRKRLLFLCKSCGYSNDADLVGSINIRNRFISELLEKDDSEKGSSQSPIVADSYSLATSP